MISDVDPSARFESPEGGLLVAETTADPADIEARVAFSRRVGFSSPTVIWRRSTSAFSGAGATGCASSEAAARETRR